MTNVATLRWVLRSRYQAVWLLMVLAVGVSWLFGTDRIESNSTVTTTVVIVVAYVKIRLVGRYFMELRVAPLVLRAVFETYCVVVCSVILTLYYVS